MSSSTSAFIPSSPGPAAQPVTALPGVGAGAAGRLARLGLATIEDLMFHLPVRYEDRTTVTPLAQLVAGQRALTQGTVTAVDGRTGRRPHLTAWLADGRGQLLLRFFHPTARHRRLLVVGGEIGVYGEVRLGPHGREMVHPEIAGATEDPLQEDALTPVYSVTAGVSVKRLRQLIRLALARVDALPDLLPPALNEAGLSLAKALHLLHAPPLEGPPAAARQRLAQEELLAHQAALVATRRANRKERAHPCQGTGLLTRFLAQLPFQPTAAQHAAIREIQEDLGRAWPMRRLLQGDVGSGKTVVAAAAALITLEAGYQAAIMAPTELLARQHHKTFAAWFADLGIPVLPLMRTSRSNKKSRARLASGEVALVIGTQALVQEAVAFDRLALAIIDEQHRFGVRQRQALQGKGRIATHWLAMSATPIPRTLAQSLYADLDVSVLAERPPGRLPVTTVALPQARRSEVIDRMRQACQTGAKAYWVCPLIEEGEPDRPSAMALHDELRQALPGLAVGLIHGRMNPAQKESVMAAFVEGDVQVLVATTVIEVGVDVPSANLLVIENAESLGLAQLHQLRGRVGRGREQGHCVLLYRAPLGSVAHARLACLRETDDGFEVAQQDLMLRGAGEIFGDRQSGLPDFRVADLAEDATLLPRLRTVAEGLCTEHAEALARRWLSLRQELGEV
ncbi:MAG: ATP-dependent DNA helicase RecG [Gammaproteobacteria bacterium]|nr:ATP-dependent DNA helicase RecG [Gammaproteobacteria bacterium]